MKKNNIKYKNIYNKRVRKGKIFIKNEVIINK